MLAQRPLKLFLIMVLIVGGSPVIGWAGGPSVLTDKDMDGIYAKGIWVNFEINIALPGGNTLSVPSITLPDITMPNSVAGIPGNIETVNVSNPSSVAPTIPNTGQADTSPSTVPASSQTSPAVAAGESAGTTSNAASPAYRYSYYPGSGIFVTDNAMQGNSGLIINAPNSAVSMSISVVVLNNSSIEGDIVQSSNSYPTNLFLSLKSYMH